MKKIIFSFDYELFFGDKSGTVRKTLIEPTNILLECLEKYNLRGNFFIDYLMFRELEKLTDDRAKSDLHMLKEQIKDIIKRGHRIELHLHPHWIDAKYNGDGTWDYADFTHYSLSSLQEDVIIEMFKDGVSYLNSLARDVEPTYEVCAFRAGGWAIQPFSKLKKAFSEANIVIDSSASYGIFRYLENSYYDFRNMPDKTMYKFEDDVCKEEAGGSFVEIPITAFNISLFQAIINKIVRLLFTRENYYEHFADGTHFRKLAKNNDVSISLWKKLTLKRQCMFSLSSQNPINILWMLYANPKHIYVCIDHPKDVSKATISCFRAIGRLSESVSYVDAVVRSDRSCMKIGEQGNL